jgi:hypothetical protein
MRAIMGAGNQTPSWPPELGKIHIKKKTTLAAKKGFPNSGDQLVGWPIVS